MSLFLDSTPGTCADDLEVVYRPEENVDAVPYWVAKCSCGWKGRPQYFRGYAMNEWREHREASEGRAAAQAEKPGPPRSGGLAAAD